MVATRQMTITTTGPGGTEEISSLTSLQSCTSSGSSYNSNISGGVGTNGSGNSATNGSGTIDMIIVPNASVNGTRSTPASTSIIQMKHNSSLGVIALAPPITRASSSALAYACAANVSAAASTSITTTTEDILKQTTHLLDLPLEILEHIFSFVPFKQIAQMRVISKPVNQICGSYLNSSFQKLQTKMFSRFQTVKAKMPRRESARRNHPLACECDIIETCHMRLSLLQMTFGKHIERKHCCFFPAGILDEVYNVLNYIRTTPILGRPYKVTDELFDLSTMAMEYFKEHIEPCLPEIANISKNYLNYNCSKVSAMEHFIIDTPITKRENSSNSLPSPPQSNMVLRKGIRKIKQGMKRYNNQLTALRSNLRSCKRKSTEQAKQITEMQKLLSDQQKQTMEYVNRLNENDKKYEEMSRKFSTLLQELNKCKTELQYWRSKSPATPVCNACRQMPVEDLQTLVNQGVKPEHIININADIELDDQLVQIQENNSIDLTLAKATPPPPTIGNNLQNANGIFLPLDCIDDLQQQSKYDGLYHQPSTSSFNSFKFPINETSVISTIGSPSSKSNGKRKLLDSDVVGGGGGDGAGGSGSSIAALSNCGIGLLSMSGGPTDNKKSRLSLQSQQQQSTIETSVISSVGSPKSYGKRKIDNDVSNVSAVSAVAAGSSPLSALSSSSSLSITDNKKGRRVQTKVRCQNNGNNNKTRSK